MRPAHLFAIGPLVTGLLAVMGPSAAELDSEAPVRLSGPGAVLFASGVPYHQVETTPSGHAVVAWLEDVGEENFQLMARSRPAGGDWTAVQQVSDATTGAGAQSVQTFDLAVNADGDAALVWRQFDTYDGDFEHMVFAATLAEGGDAWSTARVGGQAYGVTIFETPSVVVLPDGTAVAGWTGYTVEDRSSRQVYASEGGPDGWGAPVMISATGHIPVNCLPDEECSHDDSGELALAADGSGETQALMVGWTEVSDGEGGTTDRAWMLRTTRAAGGGWSAAVPVTSVADPYERPSAPRVEGDLVGEGFAFGWSLTGTTSEDPGVRLSYDGQPRTFRRESSGYRLAGLDLAGGHAGALLAYASGGGQLRVTSAEPGGGWGDLTDPTGGDLLSNAPVPRIGVHPGGEQTVLWVPDGQRIRITQRPSGSAAWPDDEQLVSSGALPLIGASAEGAGTVIWRGSVDSVPAVLGTGFTPEAVDPVPPVVTMTAPDTLWLRSPSWDVAWEVADQGGGVELVEVAESETAWDEDAATTATIEEHGPESASYVEEGHPADTAGTTFCYAARGRAVGGPTGSWSTPLCAVTPVDDRTLTRVGTHWKRKSGDGRYNRTYLQTKRKGARLRLPGVHASSLALLVEKARGHGKVKVVFDGQPLGAVSLDGKPKKRVVVPLAEWGDVRIGTLVIKVVSRTGKPVRVDGVHAAQPDDAAFTD